MSRSGISGRTRAACLAAGLSAIGVWTPPAFGLDPRKAVTQYVHDVWQVEQGLPQNSVHAMVQSAEGYLWFGTQEGLVRFDGVRFSVLDRRSTPALPSNLVFVLAADRAGRLWIGTAAGVSCLEDGKVTTFTVKDGLSSDTITSLVLDRHGDLWIGTPRGLDRLHQGRLTTFTKRDGLSDDFVTCLAEGADGSLWIGTSKGGVNRWKDGAFTSLGARDGLPDDKVWTVLEGRDGSLWVGTDRSGLARLREGVFTTLTTRDGLPGSSVYSLREDRDGNLWVGTLGDGLARIANGQIASYSARDGLSDVRVFSLFEDREGSLWVGTWGGGLNRLRDGKLTPFSSREGLPNEKASTIAEGRDGSLWVGTWGGGVIRLKDGRFTSLTAAEGLASDQVQAVFEDREGSVWIGTADAGLQRLKDGRLSSFTARDGLPSDAVAALAEDRDGSLWIGTSRGLGRLHGGTLAAVPLGDGLSGRPVRTLLVDREGSLWIGTAGGLGRLKGGQLTAFARKDGLSSDSILALHEDAEGALWIGTNDGGLVRKRGERFACLTTREGLFDDRVLQVLEDAQGSLWMSSNKGIFRASRAALNAVAEGTAARVSGVFYGTPDGMRSAECNGGSQPAGARTRDGRLWFPTMRGIVAIDPERLATNPVRPSVVVEEVLVDGRLAERPARGFPLVLPPGKEKFELRYTAPSLVVPSRVRFTYRLDGFDRDWVDAGGARAATYTNLPPRGYIFRVRACNDDGLWSETAATLEITLLPRFFQTWWFHVLEALAAAGVLAAAFALQRRRLTTRADLRRKTEELDDARRVQLALLPKEPLVLGEWTVAGRMQTATEVGGDYFGYFEAGGRLCVVVGDATGHGMASGLVAGMLKAALASLSQKAVRSEGPATWLADLNTALRTSISQRGLGVCLGIALVDRESGEVELGMAGIPHPFHVSAEGVIQRLELSGTPLGYMKRILAATATRTLGPGDRLVLTTDGLSEQVSAEGKDWGYEGVERALGSLCAKDASPEQIAHGLLAACETFGAGRPRSDDRTVVVLTRRREPL